jgi:hypothetical protein
VGAIAAAKVVRRAVAAVEGIAVHKPAAVGSRAKPVSGFRVQGSGFLVRNPGLSSNVRQESGIRVYKYRV